MAPALHVTVPMTCAICGREVGALLDPMIPPLPFGRIRVCRRCGRVTCRRHGKRVARGEFECTECRGTAAKP